MVLLETLQKQISDGTYTMTNKTLTNPKINSTGITNATSEELNITDNGQTTEKVLNVQCKCRAYLDSVQDNITDSTPTKVNLDAESYDIGGDFDTTNKRFTAPVTGYYLVCASVAWNDTITDKRYWCMIYVNGASVAQSIINVSLGAAGSSIVNCSDIVFANAGEYIELYTQQISGAATADLTASNNLTYMAIHLLSI